MKQALDMEEAWGAVLESDQHRAWWFDKRLVDVRGDLDRCAEVLAEFVDFIDERPEPTPPWLEEVRCAADRMESVAAGLPRWTDEVCDMAGRGQWLTATEWPPAEVVTYAHAAERLGVSVPHVWALANDGVLNDAGPVLVTAASVEREVARRSEAVAS